MSFIYTYIYKGHIYIYTHIAYIYMYIKGHWEDIQNTEFSYIKRNKNSIL